MKNYRKLISICAVLLVLATILPQTIYAAGFPKHENYVADDADILSEDTINLIKDTNKTLSADIQLTIAVCTVATTGDEDIADYARELFTEWKLGEGVLILIAKDDNNYYFVPSTGIEDILSNEELVAIRDEYFEGDFSNGVYERAVMKVVNKLKTTLVAGMQARAAAAAAEEEAKAKEQEEKNAEKGTPTGNAIVSFFKGILIFVLILVLAFIALFVVAMFNNDVAAFMQQYIFRFIFKRNSSNDRTPPPNYYDERLYGNRNSSARRRPNPNGYPQGQPPRRQGQPQRGYYNNGQGYPQQGYNNGRGYPQQTYNNGQGYPQQGYNNGQGYPQQGYNNGQGYPQQGYNNGQGYPQQGYNNGQGYPQQGYNNGQGYPQQGYNNGQGYPRQGYNGQSGRTQQNNRQGYRNTQQNYGTQQSYTNGDETVQFNIPRRG